ncbi:uncharacterized protein RSE6_02771 [Rhynchosporium secalis]|uniref:Uncharacterized protein n=1 Tax=Rhynchosporium secalis TaxID=38038 RepID=A0A1E1M127_RHYSE|nr:uncharacterized protein RSE6_02771 [Rhynchosporium secalis]
MAPRTPSTRTRSSATPNPTPPNPTSKPKPRSATKSGIQKRSSKPSKPTLRRQPSSLNASTPAATSSPTPTQELPPLPLPIQLQQQLPNGLTQTLTTATAHTIPAGNTSHEMSIPMNMPSALQNPTPAAEPPIPRPGSGGNNSGEYSLAPHERTKTNVPSPEAIFD